MGSDTTLDERRNVKKLIVMSGTSGAGKSTIAEVVRDLTGASIVSVREHYEQFLVPRYLGAQGLPPQCSSRELHMAAADWVYEQDPAGYVKMLLKDVALDDRTIIESLRIIGDLTHVREEYPHAQFIHVHADTETRVSRKLRGYDPLLQGKSIDEVERQLQYEWDHFRLEDSVAFLRSVDAVGINTTGYYEGRLPPGTLWKIQNHVSP
jgi:hypothetical protein